MMSKIRVLVVDDAVVVRRMVTDILSADPDIEVIGAAANGHIALAKIPQVNPDLITLDIEMPEMDGLTTLKELRKLYPSLPVIMFSTLTERGASATLDALSLGANDYVTKPANVGSVNTAMQRIREELIPKIKTFCGRAVLRDPAGGRLESAEPRRRIPVLPKPSILSRVDVVAIGVSTGGPNALAEVLPAIPNDFPVPVVITQHMPPLFTKLLADRLDNRCPLKVDEGAPGKRVKPGEAWLAPGNYHMVFEREETGVFIRTNQNPPENSCRPAVDVMIRSVVETWGAGTLAVILTGMGRDGLRGCELVKEAGGQVLVQDEATSVVWGMPGFVAEAGLADRVLPLHQIADEIVRRVKDRHPVPAFSLPSIH